MDQNTESIDFLNKICQNTLISHLKIEFAVENGELIARMPVTSQHLQPMGIMHGGASLALAETLGSAYSLMRIDRNKFNIEGINMQASHVGSISDGFVVARCVPQHIGRRTHVVDIFISDEHDRKISICRLTNMIKEK